MKKSDKFKGYEVYNDYTIKFWQQSDGKYYATVLYESDTDAEVIHETNPQLNSGMAKNIAVRAAKKHEQELTSR